MEITTQYIISQIFTIISYMFLALTYHAKNRKAVLTLNLLGQISFVIAYILLGAWSGLAMTIVALIRNVIFIIDENKNVYVYFAFSKLNILNETFNEIMFSNEKFVNYMICYIITKKRTVHNTRALTMIIK